jgi:hypothetical protein
MQRTRTLWLAVGVLLCGCGTSEIANLVGTWKADHLVAAGVPLNTGSETLTLRVDGSFVSEQTFTFDASQGSLPDWSGCIGWSQARLLERSRATPDDGVRLREDPSDGMPRR